MSADSDCGRGIERTSKTSSEGMERVSKVSSDGMVESGSALRKQRAGGFARAGLGLGKILERSVESRVRFIRRIRTIGSNHPLGISGWNSDANPGEGASSMHARLGRLCDNGP